MENLCLFWGRPEVTHNLDESTLKKVSRQPLTAETWVKSRVSLRVPCGRQNATWADCPISIIPPKVLTILLVTVMRRTSGLVLGTFKQKRWSSGRSVRSYHQVSSLSNCSGPFRRTPRCSPCALWGSTVWLAFC